MPAHAGCYQLVSEHSGKIVDAGRVVYTGKTITSEYLQEKMQASVGTSHQSMEHNTYVANAFLEELVKFKVGTVVEIVDSQEKFQLRKRIDWLGIALLLHTSLAQET